jgi:hypothetical protein
MKHYFQNNAPDSGPWIYSEEKNLWIEPNINKNIDWDNWPVRKIDENTTDIFYVDGFPRQATNTFRRMILECFPTIAIVDDIYHMENPFYQNIKIGKKCFLTIRDPLDAISSTYGYTKAEINNETILDSIINYYLRLTSIPFKLPYTYSISVVDFNDIVNSPYLILKKIKIKFNIVEDNLQKYKHLEKTNIYDKNHNFTQKEEVINYLKQNIQKLEKCYNVYNRIKKEKI